MDAYKYRPRPVLSFMKHTNNIERISRRTLGMPRAKGLARRKNKTANINVNTVRPRFGTRLSKWFFQLGALGLVYTVGKYLDSIRVSFFHFLLSYEVTCLILLSMTQYALFHAFLAPILHVRTRVHTRRSPFSCRGPRTKHNTHNIPHH